MEKPEMSQREFEYRVAEYKQAYTEKRIEFDNMICALKQKKNALITACDKFKEEIRLYNEQIRALESDRSEAKLIFESECKSLHDSVSIVTQANSSFDGFSSTQKHHLNNAITAAVKHALKDFDNVAHDGICCEYYSNSDGRLAFEVTVPNK